MTVRDAIRRAHDSGQTGVRDGLLRYALRHGATYRQLAEVVGRSESTVHGWLKGDKADIVGDVLDEPVPERFAE